ncbi:MAG: DedA family protein [Patescibacteria group bacterium]
MKIFEDLLNVLLSFANKVPIELYAIIGPFAEEIVSPIPSPFVMASAGSIAAAQNKALIYLAWLALLGAFGKTIASWILYFAADKAEDVVVGRFGKFIGISHKEVEDLGRHFNGGWRDNVIIFFARFIPIIPSSPISVVCGAIKINVWTFISSTFLGTIFRNMFYLYFGYAGLNAYESTLKGLDSAESVVQIVMVVAVAVVLVWLYYKRSKGAGFKSLEKLASKKVKKNSQVDK